MTAISVPGAEASATIVAPPLTPGPAFDAAATVISSLPPAPLATDAAPASPPPTPAAPDTPAPPVPRQASRAVRNPDATVVFRQGRLEPRNPEAGSVVQTLGLKPISIGSDPTCDLQLTAPGIAKRHAEITMTRAGFCVRDCASSATVKVNGAVVQEHVLAEGDTLLVASAQFNFRLL